MEFMPSDKSKSASNRLEDLMNGSLSRRRLLQRSALLGLSAPVVAGLLAACGEDDDDEPDVDPAVEPEDDDDEYDEVEPV
jgi:hypothetical protein